MSETPAGLRGLRERQRTAKLEIGWRDSARESSCLAFWFSRVSSTF